MGEKQLNWKDYHHRIYQLYHGIVALTLVPFALLFLEWDSGSEKLSFSITNPVTILISQLLWIIIYASWYIWKGEKVKYQIVENMTLKEKLEEYRKRNLIKYLILAFAGLIAAFAMWLEASYFFVIAYFGVLVQYSFLRPSEDKVVRDMQLTKEERISLHSH